MTRKITPHKGGRTERINARMTRQAKAKLVERARSEGYRTLADWLDAQAMERDKCQYRKPAPT